MNEEQVTKAIVRWLAGAGWTILDYDFPGSGTGRPFHVGDNGGKTKGIVIPDVIAERNGTIVLFENKSRDTTSDYRKIAKVSTNLRFGEALKNAYPAVGIKRILWAIGYYGEPKHLNLAAAAHVDIVVSVCKGVDGENHCSIVYGNLSGFQNVHNDET